MMDFSQDEFWSQYKEQASKSVYWSITYVADIKKAIDDNFFERVEGMSENQAKEEIKKIIGIKES